MRCVRPRRRICPRHFTGSFHRVEHGNRGGERKSELLHRRRARFLQVIGTDIDRIPFRNLPGREQDHVLDQAHRRRRREYIGAAREVFLDDVVLNGALQRCSRSALLVGDCDVERHQPRRGGVDGHRGVHRVERNAVEQCTHVAEMADRHANFADLAFGKGMIGVVTGLGREIEGDREACLPFGQILPVKRVGIRGRRMAGVCAENPGLIALSFVSHCVA